MDSGNETEVLTENAQPVAAVVANTEISEATPQAEPTEQLEVYIEEDAGDQEKPKTEMSQAQAYAAFQKEKRKRKDKQSELDSKDDEIAAMQKTVSELQSQVGNITRGEMPDPYDFDNKEDHYAALKEWEGTSQAKAPAKQEPAKQQADNTLADEAEFYLHQKEQELTKALPGYNDAKNAVMETFKANYGVTDPNQTMIYLSNIAKQSGVDIAKAVMAMEKVPSLVGELDAAGGNQFAIAKVLEKAANKVKTRSAKNIDTQPEPEINNSGPVNSNSAAVAKLRDAWVKKTNTANYNAYNQAKQKANEKGKN